MNKEFLLEAQKWAKEELDICVNFWLKNGLDKENGGVYTCLDREGKIYSTDKSVWMQGRCGWMFSNLYNNIEKNPQYLAMAKSAIDFARENGYEFSSVDKLTLNYSKYNT